MQLAVLGEVLGGCSARRARTSSASSFLLMFHSWMRPSSGPRSTTATLSPTGRPSTLSSMGAIQDQLSRHAHRLWSACKQHEALLWTPKALEPVMLLKHKL